MIARAFLLLVVGVASTLVFAENNQALTQRYFNQIKNNPTALSTFIKDMPKGADLHNHLAGASLAENMLYYAKKDNVCVNLLTQTIIEPPCKANRLLSQVYSDTALRQSLIDAWSMQDFHAGKETGHDHFFKTFEKYDYISHHHSVEILADIVNQAGEEHEDYIELMTTLDNNDSGKLGGLVGWNSDLTLLRKSLLKQGLPNIVNEMIVELNSNEKMMRHLLLCDTTYPKAGCDVTVRYLYQVLREQAPEKVFAQLLAGFEIASKDPRVVGINMVQPEDGTISMRDYELHMQMVRFLHRLYPNVSISLHAGELVKGLVSFQGLRFHIRDAVEVGHAERIGHGVDIAYEKDSVQLLKEMAKKHILVEINLTSNEDILGVTGKEHPLLLYLKYHVPVAISTDDEGVLRTNLDKEFEKAVLTYHLSYLMVKNIVRNSITYSFLPGQSLWQDSAYHRKVSACKEERSAACQHYLNENEKAAMQWQLEKQFDVFEEKIAHTV